MQFVTSCYGERYAAFLAVCLRSIRHSNPNCSILVTYDDMPGKIIHALTRQNPRARFIAVAQAPRETDMALRIAAKLDFWRAALEQAEGDITAFVDVDMIVRDDIRSGLPDAADILVTLKDEPIPINTGTLIFRRGPASFAFMQQWQLVTARICADKELLRTSIKKNGAPDQHALLLIMGTQRPALGLTTVVIGDQRVHIQAAPCSVYNETNSVPLSAPAKILHYKGAWHKILLKGRGYNTSRTREASEEMLSLWRGMLRDEEREIGMKLMPLKTRARLATRGLLDTVLGARPN